MEKYEQSSKDDEKEKSLTDVIPPCSDTPELLHDWPPNELLLRGLLSRGLGCDLLSRGGLLGRRLGRSLLRGLCHDTFPFS